MKKDNEWQTEKNLGFNLEFIKEIGTIDLFTLNYIKNISLYKRMEMLKKFELLDKIPETKWVKKIKEETFNNYNNIAKEYGYWIFKKLEETFPEADLGIDLEAEYNSDEGLLPHYLDKLISLSYGVSIKDVIAYDGQIIIVDSFNNIHCSRWEHFTLVDSLYDETLIKMINTALNKFGIDQSLNKKNGRFSNPNGTKVYTASKIRHNFYSKAPIDYIDLLVVSDKGIKVIQVNKMGYIREEKNINSLSKMDQKNEHNVYLKRQSIKNN